MADSETCTLTVEEVAQRLGVSRGVAYEAVRAGTIPAVRISPRRIVVPKAALARMLGEDPAK
jgi:excisionase family DNA binding protein